MKGLQLPEKPPMESDSAVVAAPAAQMPAIPAVHSRSFQLCRRRRRQGPSLPCSRRALAQFVEYAALLRHQLAEADVVLEGTVEQATQTWVRTWAWAARHPVRGQFARWEAATKVGDCPFLIRTMGARVVATRCDQIFALRCLLESSICVAVSACWHQAEVLGTWAVTLTVELATKLQLPVLRAARRQQTRAAEVYLTFRAPARSWVAFLAAKVATRAVDGVVSREESGPCAWRLRASMRPEAEWEE